MRLQKNVTVLLSVLVLLVVSPRAFAGPDPAYIWAPPVAHFVGNQSWGVLTGVDFGCPQITTLYIHDLTTNIEPSPLLPLAVCGINLSHLATDGGNGGSYPFKGGDGGNGTAAQNLLLDFNSLIFGIKLTSGVFPYPSASGIITQSYGGDGGNGGGSTGLLLGPAWGGHGGNGGNGRTVNITSNGSIQTEGMVFSIGISADSLGGKGGNGGSVAAASYGVGGNGGNGGNSNAVTVTNSGNIQTESTTGLSISYGISAQSNGGNGGNGGSANVGAASFGGSGGAGGSAGNVTVNNSGNIQAESPSSILAISSGINAQSRGGDGGSGGSANVGGGSFGGQAGAGGDGSGVIVNNQGSIDIIGDYSFGINAQSIGGIGGNGGSAIVGGGSVGGNGGVGGDGSNATVNNDGSINTTGHFSPGIRALSQGGDGGHGGDATYEAYAEGGDGGIGGSAGNVIIDNDGIIETAGNSADGIVGQSLGGAGGDGGAAGGVYGQAGGTLGSGPGGGVTIKNKGDILTSGMDSRGIFAESVGGFAGSAGGAGGLVGWGGSGNSNGDGGAVTVTNSGAITTTGDSSELIGAAILAQSIGGGGGDAASSGGVVVLGGSGTAGGDGGEVKVTNNGQLQTYGSDAYGIMAQSAGGGGGSGGSSGALVALGGGGESTGDGGRVIVENTGEITTAGDGSASIFAQSIGGGGGVVGGHGGASYSPLFTMGGSGASGGNGDWVTVNNSGNLTTSGLDSSGILAQSVGGGGGAGGEAYVWGFEAAWNKGGNSGLGGDGGQVYVDSVASSIFTEGEFSHGIHAQSLGGGGGAGGNATNITVGIQYSATSSTGGDGGDGGNGGPVNLTSSSTVTTQGEHAHGLYAQSIGGGGGSGGNATNWTINFDVPFIELPDLSIAMSVGGTGGDGGIGDAVTVDNTGDINTSGFRSYGIFAQSVGGGGGEGGNSNTGDVAINSMAISASIGGDGSDGGSGGAVDVENSGNIATQGGFAYGILGQSVGGGGGAGGNSTALLADIELIMDWEDIFSPDANFKLSVGGMSGGGGDGGRVDITNTGNINSSGHFANGIQAQSIGGGGGAGGEATSIQVELTTNPLDYLDFAGVMDADFNLLVGGNGGVAGHGGEVVVTNDGEINTEGHFANGILAQSVGGGGGTAGRIYDDSYRLTNPTSALVVGANGGAGGNGGKVVVNNDGSISTQGDFANGILAQSIGGGGGAASYYEQASYLPPFLPAPPVDFLSTETSVILGGGAGTGGNGSGVEVINYSNISTAGDFANGILAQSIGGGGGSAGYVKQTSFIFSPLSVDFLDDTSLLLGGSGGNGGEIKVTNDGDISTVGNFASGILAQSIGGGGGTGGYKHEDPEHLTNPLMSTMVLEGEDGGSGDGGNVTVENSGDITTDGRFSHGILAQSIGGGGGFVGISEDGGISTLDFDSTANGIFAENTGFGVGFAGSAGGWGSAGAVNVTHTGSITTNGDMSHGILAQSAAGYGAAGPVTVTLASDIMAYGMDSDGIHAQSVGSGGLGGDITISIGGGTVQGGSGAGAGVNIDGGANNTLTNAGSISALSGTAILGGAGNDTVNNDGIVTGTVDLGTGANAFNNHAAGIFNTGALVDLGEGNALTNAGILSPGGLGNILDTTVVGDLVQLASGVWEIEIGGFTPGSFDSIDVTGTLTGDPGLLSLSSAMGSINFSFLPGFDIASEIGPHQSMTLQFLNAGELDGLAFGMSYSVLGSPRGFQYEMFQQDAGLFLRAANTIPAPGALLLGSIGLGLVGWGRRRMRW